MVVAREVLGDQVLPGVRDQGPKNKGNKFRIMEDLIGTKTDEFIQYKCPMCRQLFVSKYLYHYYEPTCSDACEDEIFRRERVARENKPAKNSSAWDEATYWNGYQHDDTHRAEMGWERIIGKK